MSYRLAVLIALSSLCLTASQATAADNPSASAPPVASIAKAADAGRFKSDVIDKPHLPNFHEVHSYLYRSGAPDEVGLKEAKKQGIGTIIDLRNPGEIKQKGDEELWAKRLGIKYINMPMGPQAPSKETVDTFLNAVKQSQKHPQDGAVLVHCSHGSDRTGCLVGIWRVSQDGWSYKDAYDEMRHYWFTPKFTQLSGAVKDYARPAVKPAVAH